MYPRRSLKLRDTGNAIHQWVSASELNSRSYLLLITDSRWTAVVEGALMKVLAHHSPSSARIDISERRARKHYGIYVKVDFHKVEHDMSRR